jgi:hypothetical protein
MKDYSKGKIYTIRCRTDDTLIYVGGTIQPLCERKASHKKDSKDERTKNRLLYSKINGDWTNWYIELHSNYPCSCKEELNKREGELIREMGTLNDRIAGRTRKEHYQDNKEKIKQYSKEHYIKNVDKKREYSKNYYKENADKRRAYGREYKQRKRQEKLNSVKPY